MAVLEGAKVGASVVNCVGKLERRVYLKKCQCRSVCAGCGHGCAIQRDCGVKTWTVEAVATDRPFNNTCFIISAFDDRHLWSGLAKGYRWDDILPSLVLSVPIKDQQASDFMWNFISMDNVRVSYDGAKIASFALTGASASGCGNVELPSCHDRRRQERECPA